MTSAGRLKLSTPLDDADIPVTELVVPTRRAESRTVMSIVSGLLEAGVPVRDIAVVVRDLEEYEEPLRRGARQNGLATAFWTQLTVTRTTPFALIEAVCDVLGAEELDASTLCQPLEQRWCPPSAASASWPLDQQTVQRGQHALSTGAQTIDGWYDEVQDKPAIDQRFVAYLEWLLDCPKATPDAVKSVLGGVIDRYERLGLPVTKARDSPAGVETERDARAVVRAQTLTQHLPNKYADRLDEEALERSWSDVADLSRLIVTQRPGRREQSNARAVDILEANDVWLLDIPYVIAAGLVDGEWPTPTQSPLPSELQEAVLSGERQAEQLAPRTAWTDGRDRDQFDDTVRAADNGLILTRHTETISGEEQRPSYLLEYLDREVVSDKEVESLLGPDCILPQPIRRMLKGDR
ncbi:hypothetical protein ACFQJ7_08415 [Halovenus rubra]|uniref:DNA helicase n=2 Tax=Halovenus rubra TaxID=869890 RepID=A0ABD5X871_9EURY|nr:hypothetical protein [Halovenus rubra]